ncbi:MAG: hypothetical protein FWH41_10925 [Treponema sp.]|nr:hypothetical protein [Treponema sp.]
MTTHEWSGGVLNPSFPHSLDHARASTVAISLHSSINSLIIPNQTPVRSEQFFHFGGS